MVAGGAFLALTLAATESAHADDVTTCDATPSATALAAPEWVPDGAGGHHLLVSLWGGASYRLEYEARLGPLLHTWEEVLALELGESVDIEVVVPSAAKLDSLAEAHLTAIGLAISILGDDGEVLDRVAAPRAWLRWTGDLAVVLDEASAAVEAPLGIVDPVIRAEFDEEEDGWVVPVAEIGPLEVTEVADPAGSLVPDPLAGGAP